MKKISTAIVIAGISVTLLAGCGSKDKDDKTAATTASASATVEEVAVVESSSGTDTEVVAVVEESTTAMSDDAMSATASGTGDAAAPAAADGAYVSPDGAYSVDFPTAPTVQGPAAVATGADGSTYTVGSQEAPNDNLDEAVKEFSSAMGGAQNVKDVEVNGKKGKRFDFEVAAPTGKVPGTALIVIDGKTAYVVMATSMSGDAAATAAFVDSFKLLK